MRAAADALDVAFRVGDAQALPFADAAFDVVLSVYGAQFAPDQQRAASELLRVCRPGGRIALASPMPQYRSVEHGVEVFSTYFGPTIRALHAVDSDAREQLRADLRSVFARYNRANDGTAVVENTYLQTIATRA